MGSILSLRHYSHDQIVHSHDHAQLVLGLSGCLEFEVEGRGSRASERQPPRQQPRLPLASLDAYLDRHAAHPLQVADLARLAGLSVARFHSLFLAETGQTPMDYARSRRLHQAHELLLESSLAVGEIAARVGYASQSAFTAALVREFGVTPRQLRRESRDKTG
ncbi:AraC family transcriptional regulator [Pseudomonas aeruginosa]|uniref:AraC family transcriptional regulator n=1 Tax=Pseudomonas aeruginosa TaxID=287 RepID=UPI00104EC86C|nr:AraC family transcriptional regulator [Pseudomonas aeruginosa]